MLCEEIEILFISDSNNNHLSVPCFFLSIFTCCPAAGEILTFSFVNTESVWSVKTDSKHPAIG